MHLCERRPFLMRPRGRVGPEYLCTADSGLQKLEFAGDLMSRWAWSSVNR